MLDDISATNERLRKLNNGELDEKLQKENPELADDLAEGIANTQRILNTINIPVGNSAKIGKTLNFPDN